VIHRYTSLGSTYNTSPNPALLLADPSFSGLQQHIPKDPYAKPLDTVPICLPAAMSRDILIPPAKYRPAYELLDGSLERAGRGAHALAPQVYNN
jgi:FAD synthetase